MSAWIVSKAHIDLLITAGLRPLHGEAVRWVVQANPHKDRKLEHDNADDVGSMLWRENFASVGDRYPDDDPDDLPGSGVAAVETLLYRWARIAGVLDPVVVLKAIHCYEYQSCEHDGWAGSQAKAFCEALTGHAVRGLPGYQQAPWGFDDPTYFVKR
jgi:hypothetical protein